jgi:hypothetical protein
MRTAPSQHLRAGCLTNTLFTVLCAVPAHDYTGQPT